MRKSILMIGAAAALLSLPNGAAAQVRLGGQLSWAEDGHLGLGARLAYTWPFEPGTQTIGAFDYFFPDGFDLWEVNINLAHTIPSPADDVGLYAGGGLNWAHFSNGRSGNEFGLNLAAGVKYFLPSVIPYGEVRFEFGGGKQYVFTAGVLFDIGQ